MAFSLVPETIVAARGVFGSRKGILEGDREAATAIERCAADVRTEI